MSNGIPVPPAPLEDQDLDLLLQAVVVGCTGLDGSLVVPRWQPTLPRQPEPSVNWCAIGVTGSTPDAFPYIAHQSGFSVTDPAGDILWRHEELDVLASFYGPRAKYNAGALRDGLCIVQNTELLEANQVSFVEAGREQAAPDFINQQWIRRYDMPLRFRRKVQRVYGIQNIIAAQIDLFDDSGHVNRVINVPPP